MKDEIKEILDCIKDRTRDYVGMNGCLYQDLEREELNLLLNYITNLQTIEQQYSAILSENAELENKITNLQKENERLTQGVALLTSKFIDMKKEKEDYKSRIDKAIEYIKNSIDNTGWLEIGSNNVKNLLEILGGKEND